MSSKEESCPHQDDESEEEDGGASSSSPLEVGCSKGDSSSALNGGAEDSSGSESSKKESSTNSGGYSADCSSVSSSSSSKKSATSVNSNEGSPCVPMQQEGGEGTKIKKIEAKVGEGGKQKAEKKIDEVVRKSSHSHSSGKSKSAIVPELNNSKYANSEMSLNSNCYELWNNFNFCIGNNNGTNNVVQQQPQWNGVRIKSPMDPRIDLRNVRCIPSSLMPLGSAESLAESDDSKPSAAGNNAEGADKESRKDDTTGGSESIASIDNYLSLLEACRPFFHNSLYSSTVTVNNSSHANAAAALPLSVSQDPRQARFYEKHNHDHHFDGSVSEEVSSSSGFTSFFTTTHSNSESSSVDSNNDNDTKQTVLKHDSDSMQDDNQHYHANDDDDLSMKVLARSKRKHQHHHHHHHHHSQVQAQAQQATEGPERKVQRTAEPDKSISSSNDVSCSPTQEQESKSAITKPADKKPDTNATSKPCSPTSSSTPNEALSEITSTSTPNADTRNTDSPRRTNNDNRSFSNTQARVVTDTSSDGATGGTTSAGGNSTNNASSGSGSGSSNGSGNETNVDAANNENDNSASNSANGESDGGGSTGGTTDAAVVSSSHEKGAPDTKISAMQLDGVTSANCASKKTMHHSAADAPTKSTSNYASAATAAVAGAAAAAAAATDGTDGSHYSDNYSHQQKLLSKKRKRMNMRKEYEEQHQFLMDSDASFFGEETLQPGKQVTLDEVLSFTKVARLVIQSSPPFLTVHANAAFTALSGIDCHAAIGKSISSLISLPESATSSSGAASPRHSSAANGTRTHSDASRNEPSHELPDDTYGYRLGRLVASSGFGRFHAVNLHACMRVFGRKVNNNATESHGDTERERERKAENISDDEHFYLNCRMAVCPVVSTKTNPPFSVSPNDDQSESKHSNPSTDSTSKRRKHHHQHQHQHSTASHRGHRNENRHVTHFLIQLELLGAKKPCRGSISSSTSTTTTHENKAIAAAVAAANNNNNNRGEARRSTRRPPSSDTADDAEVPLEDDHMPPPPPNPPQSSDDDHSSTDPQHVLTVG